MSTTISLRSTRHPHKNLKYRYDQLFGIDSQKKELLASLQLILQPDRIHRWQKKHHPKGLPFFGNSLRQSPLVLLSGDVGCGKTELAQTIGTPLSKEMGGETIVAFDTPSDVRGTGLVGEVSARITAAFSTARHELKPGEFGMLIIDEADDLATSREQAQAHHEDRAGVNALIKEIDVLEGENIPMAVLLITNRPGAIDPAVLRRAGTHLHFVRPNEQSLRAIFEQATGGLKLSRNEVGSLVKACRAKDPIFSYSDIFRKVARTAVLKALEENVAVSAAHILTAIESTSPSPLFQE